MKIALLSGAVKNAGDFLITRRTIELLNDVYPEAKISTYVRTEPLTPEQIQEINHMDALVIGGGPCYKWDIYPQSLPLVKDLLDLKPVIFMLGCGWYGNTTTSSEIWNYKFSESSKRLLSRILKDTEILGCRDYYAVKVLKANGIDNSSMTGCPAWYDISKIGKRLEFDGDIRKIAISDPADIIHYGSQSLEIAKYIRRRYPSAEIIYLFHRGIETDRYTDSETSSKINTLRKELETINITSFDISYSDKGFVMYNDCDLHIGHRVHAHIYNLSQRKCSILIEEDSRGAGVNEALGLWGIKAYARKKRQTDPLLMKCYNKVFDYTLVNRYCIAELDAYMNYILKTDGKLMNLAYSTMETYFEDMRFHISTLKNFL